MRLMVLLWVAVSAMLAPTARAQEEFHGEYIYVDIPDSLLYCPIWQQQNATNQILEYAPRGQSV